MLRPVPVGWKLKIRIVLLAGDLGFPIPKRRTAILHRQQPRDGTGFKQFRGQGQGQSEVDRAFRNGERWSVPIHGSPGLQGSNQPLLVRSFGVTALALQLASQVGHLFHREQGGGTGHQADHALVQVLALTDWKLLIATGLYLGSQMETGLLNGSQQARTEHLQIQG